MKRRCGFGLAALVAVFVALAGCGRRDREPSDASGAFQRVGPFQISATNRPERPIVGDNTLVVVVRDSSGQAVSDVEVSALVVMPAMGAMPRMEGRGEFRPARAGVYEGKYGLQMQGEWDVTLSILAPDGRQAVAQYRLSTSTKELAFAGGTPAAGAGAHQHGAGSGGEIPPAEAGTVVIDPARRQAIGIRTGPAEVRDLDVTIRAAGRVAYDETRRAEVSLKFSGWVRTIAVDYVGRAVRKGEPLLTVYSPELLSAQQEYLEALKAGTQGSDLAEAARQRLRLWDIDAATLDAIARSGKAMESLPIVAPVAGIVVEKNVVAGSSFTAGQTLYKLAPIHPVWVLANVYQYELPLVRVGMAASIVTPFPGEPTRAGRVSYVNPFLDPETRTGEIRAEVPNPRADLKPGMFVDVVLERRLGPKLSIPESAVLYAGVRRVVFVDLGEGRLAPREVQLGVKAGDRYEVVSGLRPGDVVVTSGNFLVAAESRLRSAAQKW